MKKLCNFTAILAAMAAAATLFLTGCSSTKKSETTSIAVYVPGICADSPIYANLVKGVQKASDEYNASSEGKKTTVYVMEAGTNQAEWGTKLKALTATGKYDVIISSNPSLPELAEPLTTQFPSQKYIFLDGALSGNNNISTISYDQKEQAYLSGYIAGLMSKNHKVGLIAAQEYPIMNNVLHPYFAYGAASAVKGTTCDFRIVGNWYDASKGSEIALAMFENGVDVVLPICGGASRGVISAAQEKGAYLTWFDENAFDKAPGTIISSCLVNQEEAAYAATLEFLNGKTKWGQTKVVGLKEGFVTFVQDDPLYIQTVPENVRNTMAELLTSLKETGVNLPE